MRPVAAVALALLAVAAAGGCAASNSSPMSFLGRVPDPRTGRVEFRPVPARDGDPSCAAWVEMEVTPGELCAANGTFTVSWSGAVNASASDYIAIYSPADSVAADYLDYLYVREAPTWASGNGSVEVSLLNLRTDYQFRYFTGADACIGTTDVLPVCGLLPLQAHLSLTGNETEMRLMWVSDSEATPTVRFGPDPHHLEFVATGTSHTYQASDMCEQPATTVGARLFRPVGWIHDVLMWGLVPGSVVYYQYGSSDAWSSVERFRAAPVPAADVGTSFLIYGDMGAGYYVPPATYTAERVVQHARYEEDVDFVMHIGDICYARSVGWIWDLFGNLIQGAATRVPYMVEVGNHEYDHLSGGEHDPSGAPAPAGFQPSWGNYGTDSMGECGRPLYERYHMPDNGNSLFWYSFNYGPVHLLVLSTEHDPTPGSDMHAFAEADLAAVDRSVTPWVLMTGHRSMYSSEPYESDMVVGENLRANLEPLMRRYGVDVYVAGHYHAAEVTRPVFNATVVPGGTIHFTVGTAGASLDTAGWVNNSWSQFQEATKFAYGRFTAIPPAGPDRQMALVWELRATTDDSLLHSLTLVKPAPSPSSSGSHVSSLPSEL